MKKWLIILVCAVLVGGTTLVVAYPHKASATVPGTNELIDTDSSGDYANAGPDIYGVNDSAYPSGNGQYVAFDSAATNLVSGDTNGDSDVFVKNVTTDSTTRASVSGTNTQIENSFYVKGLSYDGRYVLMMMGDPNYGRLYVRDTVDDTLTSVCGGNCTNGVISGDGHYVMYTVIGAYNVAQVYEQNVQTGASILLSAGSSGDGVDATNVIGGLSCDGSVAAFTSSLPGYTGDSYIATRGISGSEQITQSSVSGNATQVSCNGNVILYGNVEYNRLTGQTTTLPDGTGVSISDDGRYVAFTGTNDLTTTPSYPTTDAGSDGDGYVYDTYTGVTQLVTFTTDGNHSGEVWNTTQISADGTKVVYGYITPTSTDTGQELVSGVTTGTSNTQKDIYESDTGF
jgi:hypothetical protein